MSGKVILKKTEHPNVDAIVSLTNTANAVNFIQLEANNIAIGASGSVVSEFRELFPLERCLYSLDG